MYLVFEIQKFSDTQVAVTTPIFSTDNLNQAESEFHRVCSFAAVSNLQKHTVILVSDEGFIHKIESFDNASING